MASHWKSSSSYGERVGPGYYEAAASKDKTQSRRLKQPVVSNWKKGYTSKAECLSATILAGHHWKEKVPRLGECDEQHARGIAGHKENSSASVAGIRSSMPPESYEKYRQQQVLTFRPAPVDSAPALPAIQQSSIDSAPSHTICAWR
jgi:hypothetical protein